MSKLIPLRHFDGGKNFTKDVGKAHLAKIIRAIMNDFIAASGTASGLTLMQTVSSTTPTALAAADASSLTTAVTLAADLFSTYNQCRVISDELYYLLHPLQDVGMTALRPAFQPTGYEDTLAGLIVYANLLKRALTGYPVGAAMQDDGGSYTDYTTEANEDTANDVVPFATGTVAAADRFCIGYAEKWGKCAISLTTAMVHTGAFTLKYWNGSAWSALTATDDTTGLEATAGLYEVEFTPPSDWAAVELDTEGEMYYIAFQADADISGTHPLIGQIFIDNIVDTNGNYVFGSLRSIVNDIKAALNTEGTVTISATSCGATAGIADASDQATLNSLMNELKDEIDLAVTLLVEVKTDTNADTTKITLESWGLFD
jgi:hypothetical protein